MNNHIWIFAEHKDGELIESSLELICEGRRLADHLKEKLCVIIFGHGTKALAESLSQYGMETICLVDDELCDKYRADIYAAVLAGFAKACGPDILLLSSTAVGQDLAPRVAAKLNTCLASNCDKLQISDEGLLLCIRLAYQNKVHITVVCRDAKPQMATVSPGIAKVKKTSTSPEFNILSIDPVEYMTPEMEKVKITGFIKADPKTIDISDAELIVSGGKGVKNEDGFALIHDLADVLGASVAGSRVAVDNQWIDRIRQIGQSGKTVSPDLMISCGISGASAHTFGMRDTKNLIAINEDKAAPIMKLADLGVVGDLHEILPELIDRLKKDSIKRT